MNIAIIDISRLLYIITSKKTFGEENVEILKNELDRWIEEILDVTHATNYLIFGDLGSFRRTVIPEYKANRVQEKPKYLDELRNYCITKWNCILHPSLEADDLVIINHNYYTSKGYNCIICTGDSDLQQYPARFYNPTNKKFKTVEENEASLNLWTTVLAGGHNGLKGLKGCGIKTATNYLNKVTKEEYRDYVLKAYLEGISKEKGIKEIKKIDNGLEEFEKNFVSSYLLRNLEDCEKYNIDTNNVISNLCLK